MTRVAVTSEMAIVALCDTSIALPSAADQESLIRHLEPLARTGKVFYLVTDDPLSCRVELLAGEAPSPELTREFEPSGGTFGLELPTGTVALHGWNRAGHPVQAGTVQASAGRQALSVLARRPFEGARHARDMGALLGAEWRYMERVNRLGLVGCLPLVLGLICVLAQKWRWLWFVLPLLAVSWLPYMLLRHGPRYQAAARREQDVEEARPHYAFSVMPTDRETLAGGFLRV